MSKFLCYTRPGRDHCTLMHIVVKPGETEDDAVARMRAKQSELQVATSYVIDESDIPTDRYFRDAWECSE